MAAHYSKNLLGNVIRHTESHNRRVEENEMWAQRSSEKKRDRSRNSYYEYGNTASTSTRKAATSNKWSIELQKYEDSLGAERWGHGGYKELYPDEFDDSPNDTKSVNKRKSSDMDSDSDVHKKTKKKKTKDKDTTHPSKHEKHKKQKRSSKRDKKKKRKHKL